MRLFSRAVAVVLALSPSILAAPQRNDLLRRTDGSTLDTQAADAADAADAAAAEEAIDTALDNMFMDAKRAPPETTQRKLELSRRTESVKQAFLHSWGAYKAKGLPQDEIRPVSGTPYSTRYGRRF